MEESKGQGGEGCRRWRVGAVHAIWLAEAIDWLVVRMVEGGREGSYSSWWEGRDFSEGEKETKD